MPIIPRALLRPIFAAILLLPIIPVTSAFSNELKPKVPVTKIAATKKHSGHTTQNKPMFKIGTVEAGPLLIEGAWTRQSPPASKVVGGYLSITNSGTVSDWLTGGTADFAKRVEVHQMSVTHGIMKMRPLPNGVEIRPGETVELKPGSFHLMFLGATSPKAGETVPVTLIFRSAGSVVVQMPVAKVGAGSAPMHDHDKLKHGE